MGADTNAPSRIVTCPSCKAARFKWCVDAHNTVERCCQSRVDKAASLTPATRLRLSTADALLDHAHRLDYDNVADDVKQNARRIIREAATRLLRGSR